MLLSPADGIAEVQSRCRVITIGSYITRRSASSLPLGELVVVAGYDELQGNPGLGKRAVERIDSAIYHSYLPVVHTSRVYRYA